jgi:cytoskeletal protein RodZ
MFDMYDHVQLLFLDSMKAKSQNHQDYQVQKLVEIGSQLKQIREEKDISLEKIKQITLISERHLRAIEEGNINHLPEPVYIQGFIRKYAHVLGAENIAEQFPLTSVVTKSSWLKSSELRPLHLYLIYLVLISGSIAALSKVFSSTDPVRNPISESETQLSNAARLKPSPAPKQPVLSTTPLNQPKPNQVKPVNVAIIMKGDSWMRVEVDGEVKFEGILTEGNSKVWAANKNIIVRAGNAAAVLLEFNQYPPQALGLAGEVVQKTFDPNSKLSPRV